MDEKLITISKADYEVAKDAVIQEALGNNKLTDEAKLYITSIGSGFAEKNESTIV